MFKLSFTVFSTPQTFNDTCKSCNAIVCQFTKYEKGGDWMMWYNVFGFFWAMEFVTAFGEMVLAGVFARW